ncbi:MAG: HDOD domain-containing protein [Spirochaetaceae bacterium]
MIGLYNKYIFDLPVNPTVVSQILGMQNNNLSSKTLEDIIKIDPCLTTRLLKVSNSSYYTRVNEITTIKDCITLLGINKLKAICLLIINSEIINNQNDQFYSDYWRESLNTAFIAQAIANDMGKSVIADDLFTAGILHNIGQALLYNFSNDKYSSIYTNQQYKSKLSALEVDQFGLDNHEVASDLLKSWDFPKVHIEVVGKYMNTNTHSIFQNILDIVSLSKLISIKITDSKYDKDLENLFLIYQSRSNIRPYQIEEYIHNFETKTKESHYYKFCNEIISK